MNEGSFTESEWAAVVAKNALFLLTIRESKDRIA
jgi:hypothetical protein